MLISFNVEFLSKMVYFKLCHVALILFKCEGKKLRKWQHRSTNQLDHPYSSVTAMWLSVAIWLFSLIGQQFGFHLGTRTSARPDPPHEADPLPNSNISSNWDVTFSINRFFFHHIIQEFFKIILRNRLS